MSTTRLLVLGVVRIFQPVHGYVVRRELLSWRVEDWANIKPGSIYGALRSLVKDGHIEEVSVEQEGGRPARTTYRLTDDGEVAFFTLFREHLWWSPPSTDPAGLMAALCFMPVITRKEMIQAMAHRANQLDGVLRAQGFVQDQIRDAPAVPEHVAEMAHIGDALIRGQQAWTRDFLTRLQAGEYWFSGEPDSPFTPSK